MSDVILDSIVHGDSVDTSVSSDSASSANNDVALDSWDDEGVSNATVSTDESDTMSAASVEVDEESSDSAPSDNEEAKDENVEAKDEGKEAKADDEVQQGLSELPKELQEKGLVKKDDAIGKMIKIDGQETFVSLEELGNDYSGQKAIAKKFTEIDKKEKGLKQEIQVIEKYIDDFASKMQKGDIVGAFEYFGQFSGAAPHDIKEALLAALTPEIVRRSQMSEVEIKNEVLEAQNNYLKKVSESEFSKKAQEQASTELERQITQLREAHSISEEEFSQALSELESESELKGKVSPKDVVEYIQDVNNYKTAETVLNLVNADLAKDEAILDSLFDIVKRNPDFTHDDLKKIVEEAYGGAKIKQSSDNLQSRVEKHSLVKEKPKAAPQKSEVTVKPSSYEMNWDDL